MVNIEAHAIHRRTANTLIKETSSEEYAIHRHSYTPVGTRREAKKGPDTKLEN